MGWRPVLRAYRTTLVRYRYSRSDSFLLFLILVQLAAHWSRTGFVFVSLFHFLDWVFPLSPFLPSYPLVGLSPSETLAFWEDVLQHLRPCRQWYCHKLELH